MRFILSVIFLLLTEFPYCQPTDTSSLMAETVLKYFPATRICKGSWSYEQGLLYQGLEQTWETTGNANYLNYLQACIDSYISDSGTIRTYEPDKYKLDDILNGRTLLMLYQVTEKEKYIKAAQLLYKQLQSQPRIPQGGFWHKKIYPDQMWLDGLYMAEPFYAAYASWFKIDSAFDDIANQFILCEKYIKDKATGLYFHGWDESRQQKWANKTTGLSLNFWARGMGWFGMALVDVLDYFPESNVKRKKLIAILQNYAESIVKVQDTSGLWWNILNYPGKEKNYLEASASCMFVYTLAKAIRKGYISINFTNNATKGYNSICHKLLAENPDSTLVLKNTVVSSGLGGNQDHYRDGSYNYYVNEKIADNDLKGIGSFLLAASEMKKFDQLHIGHNKTVLLDSYYNNEKHKDKSGILRSFHYKWEEQDNNGYSFWGNSFQQYGASIKTCYTPPNDKILNSASVYIITDPDIPRENPNAKYMNERSAEYIFNWVKKGGVLVILTNDSGNADLQHVNILTSKFDFTFNNNSLNHVPGHVYDSGAVYITIPNPVFTSPLKVYLKEVSTIHGKDVLSIMQKGNDIFGCYVKAGKGYVIAVGDPWFYNEYINGRKLPSSFKNYEATQQFTLWLLNHSKEINYIDK